MAINHYAMLLVNLNKKKNQYLYSDRLICNAPNEIKLT